jgi:glycosyltransferase involved in cell wall biosynthesis
MEDGMKLLALVDDPEHVCCRYRIRAFEPALRQAEWSVSYQGIEAGVVGRTRQLVCSSAFDAVILQRKLLPAWQLAILRRAAKRIVFDFDDAVLYRDSYDPRGIRSGRKLGRFGRTMRAADAVIAGNDFLADCAVRSGADPGRTHRIPTCVEPHDYPVAPHYAASGAQLDLVWIGSSSTLKGLEESRPIWAAIASALPNVRLRVICDRFPTNFPLPVVAIPWKRHTESAELARAQIGVGWLPADDWSRGKCGLKILQYQAAGLPVVANPVGSHLEMVTHGETGFLPITPADWAADIARLAGDRSLRQRMGTLARQRVEREYSVLAWSQAFVAVIGGAGAGGTELVAGERLALGRAGVMERHSNPAFNLTGSR